MSDHLDDLQRIGVKLPLDLTARATPDLEPLITLFQGWIRSAALPGLLLDVADYRHVPDGPGVMLVAHEGDWSLDLGAGGPGLQYVRKTPQEGDLAGRIRLTLALAAQAAAMLPWPVRGDDFTVFANDRLRAPNTSETKATLAQAVLQAAGPEIVGDDVSLELLQGDPRERACVRVRGGDIADAAALLERLNAAP